MRGVPGRGCLELTKGVIDALGGEVNEQTLTEEADEGAGMEDLFEPRGEVPRPFDPTRIRR